MGMRKRVAVLIAACAAPLTVAALAITGSSSVVASPVYAASPTPTPSPSPTATPTPYPTLTQHALEADGNIQFGNNNNDIIGVLECHAKALPDAVAVAISSCTVDGQSAPELAFSGPAAATAATFTGMLTDRLEVCWSAFAVFAEATLGPQTLQTSGCKLISPGS